MFFPLAIHHRWSTIGTEVFRSYGTVLKAPVFFGSSKTQIGSIDVILMLLGLTGLN
jgi:hypothetical protein